MTISIVPANKIQNDPQQLLYHFPSIHPVKFIKMSKDYNYWRLVHTAELVAKASGRILVPADCLHWKRRKSYQDRRIVIQRKVFFVVDETDMTHQELDRYMETAAAGG